MPADLKGAGSLGEFEEPTTKKASLLIYEASSISERDL